ncbi:hypothetical protein BDZ91DRAFT_414708 [Kalaharituber pfeilii]|nr:hypothetical protein BDZ91DRAFT_414708 [Kalaharituber pfeilii]
MRVLSMIREWDLLRIHLLLVGVALLCLYIIIKVDGKHQRCSLPFLHLTGSLRLLQVALLRSWKDGGNDPMNLTHLEQGLQPCRTHCTKVESYS